MALKVSLKRAVIILFSSIIAMIFFACLDPVDIQTFLKDPQVQEVIDSLKPPTTPEPKVILVDSEGTAGNACITGLTSQKYYRIEELDENNAVVETNFVTAGGTLCPELKDIRKLNGNSITGLTNDSTYRVKSADLYSNDAQKIKYFAILDGTAKDNNTISNGTVTISENRQPATKCYFDVSSSKITVAKDYKVMRIGTDPWVQERISAVRKAGLSATVTAVTDTEYDRSSINPILLIGIYKYNPANTPAVTTPNFLSGMNIMELPEVGSGHDYVFVEYTTSDVTGYFCVLTVNVKQPSGDTSITINPPDIPAGTLTLTPAPTVDNIIPISLGGSKTITVTGGGSYSWYCDDYQPITTISAITVSGDIMTIGNTATPGTYSIIVEGTVGNVICSKRFILKITL